MSRGFKYILLFVSDLDRSVAFYRDALGFTYEGHEAPHIARFKFGESVLYLHHDGGDPKGEFHGMADPRDEFGGLRRRGAGVLIGYGVDDADAYFREVSARGVKVLHEPKDEEWGERDFSVRDLDGYEIWFSQAIKRD